MEYRNKTTGQVLSYQELLQASPNVYIPPLPTEEYMAALEYDIVQEVVPEREAFTDAVRNGIEQGEDGKWYQKWEITPWTAEMIAEHEAKALTDVADQKKAMAAKIDDAVAQRISNSTRFSLAYEQREAAARAYKDAGYEGDATEWVTRFADNTGMTHPDAADLILAQAAGLRNALMKLDNLRMDKYRVLNASGLAEAAGKFNVIMQEIEAVVIP